MTARAEVFDHMSALADPVRSRMLLILDRHELTVNEVCAVLQLPQSTTSRQLKTLADERWVSVRADGTSRWYSMKPDRLDPSAKRLWALVREQISPTTTAEQDSKRLASVLGERRSASRRFFSTTAGSWDRLRTEMFGQRPELKALLGLIDDSWAVGDLGCGTGQLAEALAPFVRKIIAVDESNAMLAAARKRLTERTNVDIRKGEVESLPIESGDLDAAILFLVLHYVQDPESALAEVRRVLRAGGRLLLVDMMPHDREEYSETMGHVWQGFSEAQLSAWLAVAGFEQCQYRALSPDPLAKGPVLFAATARRSRSDKKAGVGYGV